MDDFRFRRLEQFRVSRTGDRMELSLPLPQSPTGKVHRCCPDEECTPGRFQLAPALTDRHIPDQQHALIRRHPNTPGTTCPYCGTDASDQEFTCQEDIDAAVKQVEWAVTQDAGEYLEGLARSFNLRVGRASDLIKFNMSVKRPRNPRPFVWREDLLRDLTCDICGRRYGVYAIGLFCPDCGARNLHVHFAREQELVNQQSALANAAGAEGKNELAYRLLGNAHEDVLTAFETCLKTIYRFLVRKRPPNEAVELSTKKAIGNSFQNIERGRKLYAKLGLDPFATLDAADLDFLRLNIEKRHVVGHNLSMADEAYTETAQGEQPGQTVFLLADEVQRFADLCGRVIVALVDDAPEFLPPQPAAQ